MDEGEGPLVLLFLFGLGGGNNSYLRSPDSYRDQKIEVRTDEFKGGMYVVRIQSSNSMATKKIGR